MFYCYVWVVDFVVRNCIGFGLVVYNDCIVFDVGFGVFSVFGEVNGFLVVSWVFGLGDWFRNDWIGGVFGVVDYLGFWILVDFVRSYGDW